MAKRKLPAARKSWRTRRDTLFARYNKHINLSYAAGPNAARHRRIALRAKALMFVVIDREPASQGQVANFAAWNQYRSERGGIRAAARRMANAY